MDNYYLWAINAKTYQEKTMTIENVAVESVLELVAQMRTAQREYFSSRSKIALNQAKKLELEVDRKLGSIRDSINFGVFWIPNWNVVQDIGRHLGTTDIVLIKDELRTFAQKIRLTKNLDITKMTDEEILTEFKAYSPHKGKKVKEIDNAN